MQSSIQLPSRLSFSSLSTLAECGEKWRLTRGFKLEEHTYWATIGGSAVHDCAEQLIKLAIGEDAKLVPFEEAFAKYEAEETARGIEIKASGKMLKELGINGGPNKKDRDWWLHYGPQFVAAFAEWMRAKTELEGWTVLAAEHPFEVTLADEKVVGKIDLVMVDDAGMIRIIDLKTGAETPGKVQLATYRNGLYESTGLNAAWGAYLRFDAETGEAERAVFEEETGKPALFKSGPRKGQVKVEKVKVEGKVYCYLAGQVDYETYSPEYVEHQFRMARKQLESGIFLPNTRNNCASCGVRDYCRAVGGRKALMIPIEAVLVPPKRHTEESENLDAV